MSLNEIRLSLDLPGARHGADRDGQAASPVAARSFAPGEEVVYDVGERHAPAWLVLEGTIDVVGRDGLAHEVAITTHRPGQITGELSQLTGRAALARGRAGLEGCTALPFDVAHLRALVVGSAELGEVVMCVDPRAASGSSRKTGSTWSRSCSGFTASNFGSGC